jgi:hypothetical protein
VNVVADRPELNGCAGVLDHGSIGISERFHRRLNLDGDQFLVASATGDAKEQTTNGDNPCKTQPIPNHDNSWDGINQFAYWARNWVNLVKKVAKKQ